MVTFTLPADVAERVEDEAERRGVEPSALLTSLVDQALPPRSVSADNRATLALLDEWAAEEANLTPEELERNRIEGEQFIRNLDQNRRDMEGPNARRLWP